MPWNRKKDGVDYPVTLSSFQILESLLASRHSCRGFLPKPVPRTTIEQILVASQRTASWCNAQPWSLYVASGGVLERLRALLPELATQTPPNPDIEWPREYRGVYRERRRECGFALYDAVSVAKGDRVASAKQGAENLRMFGAPHMAIVTYDEALGTYGAVDCGAYVATFMLVAESLGVATIAQAALATYPAPLREHLGIPKERTIVCGISFGYADAAHPANKFRTTRAPLGETVTWVE